MLTSALTVLLCLLAVPVMFFGGASMLFANGGGGGCVPGPSASTVAQPGVSTAAVMRRSMRRQATLIGASV